MRMAALLLGMLAAILPQTPVVRTLQVLVVDGRSEPVPNVQVSLQPTGDIRTTNRDGVAEFAGVDATRYQIHVLHDGVQYPATASINARLVNVRVRVGASISGRIRTPEGKPATNLRVEIGRVEIVNGRPTVRSWTRTDTDQDGVYRAPAAALGQYYIRAGHAPDSQNLTDTFYPGTTDSSVAQTVAVRDWVQHAGFDFELQTPKTFKISGRVVTPAKAAYSLPQPNVEFTIGRLNSPVQGLAMRLEMPAVEEFVLDGVPTGQWEITAAIYRPDRSLAPGTTFDPLSPISVSNALVLMSGELVFAFAAARARVAVDDRDVERLVLTVNPPNIHGRIAGLPDGSYARRIQLLPKGYVPPGNLMAEIRAGGVFSLTGVPPGRYSLRAELPVGYYVESVRVDAVLVDERDGGFDLSDGDNAQIDVTIRKGTGTIEGTLRAFNPGNEVELNASSLVVLTPAPPRENNTALHKTTTIAATTGTFTFTEVPPGEYRVYAWASPRDSSPETLARYATFSTAVAVREGSISRVDAYLIPDD